MLIEPRTARRRDGDLQRRWFTDEHMDLYLWFEGDGALVRMQLCYDKPVAQRVLWWTRGEGFRHDRIDDGEGVAGRPRSPILVADGACDVDSLMRNFRAASLMLDDTTFNQVYGCLVQYKHRC